MAFNILDIMNAATKAEAGQNRDYQDIVVNYRDIVVTKHNKYSMDELQEIATGIEMDGLQQPLVLGRVNGEYWLVSGHRRLGGIKILVAEGKAGFENVKCRYKDMTEIEFRIALLVGNTFNRKMTDYDLMTQAAEWKEVLTQARKEGLLILEAGERVRDYVAAVMGEKVPKIRTLNTIHDNATPEVKEQFKNYGGHGSGKSGRGHPKGDCPGGRGQGRNGSRGNKSHGRGKEAPKDQGRGNQGSQCVRYRHNRGRKGKRQEVARRKDD